MLGAFGDLRCLDLAESGAGEKLVMETRPEIILHCAALANIDLARGAPEPAKTNLRTAIDLNPRNVADCHFCSHCSEGNYMRYLVMAVFIYHIPWDIFPSVLIEVNINIG